MKKIIAFILALLLAFGALTSCKKDKEDTDTGVSTEETEAPDTEEKEEEEEEEEEEPLITYTYNVNSQTPGIKILGVRNLASDKSINIDWSCSGVEFDIDHQGGSVRFNFALNNTCYFRVWVDGEQCMQNGRSYLEVTQNGIMKLPDLEKGTHRIRLVKMTGYTLSRVELLSISFAGTILTDTDVTKEKDLYIEFVGDSITCGYGVLNSSNPNDGTYSAQDGTQAYSYLLADALDADYSMVALSGHTLINQIESGYNYACPAKDARNKYDFARKADIVVINVGTNDRSQKLGEDEFRTAYLNFLQTVRDKNGADCKILCLYNAMNDTYSGAILSAIEEFGGTNAGVVAYELDRANNNNHPNAAEHKAYAEELKAVIQNLPEPHIPTISIIPTGKGDSDGFGWSDLED